MYLRKTSPQLLRRRRAHLQLEPLEERCVPAVIEAFEGGAANFAQYSTVLRNLPAAGTGLGSIASHDGANGLVVKDGYEWLVRNDAAVQVGQGQTFFTWVRFANAADGRAYFGFGATPNRGIGTSGGTSGHLNTGRTLSAVLAANTGQFLLQNNSAFAHTNLAVTGATTVTAGYAADQWYKVEVIWGTTGNITANLYASDGTTLLNSISTTSPVTAVTAGGIAFRGFGSDKYFDTVDRTGTATTSSPDVGRALIPARTLTRTEGGAGAPFQYQSIPGTQLDVALSRYDGITQGGRPIAIIDGVPTVGLAGANNSFVLGSMANYFEQGWGPVVNGLFSSATPVETSLLHQYMFRWIPGDVTRLIGIADVKHFFSSAHTDFQHLQPGQQDTYDSGLNANQTLFSPRSEVDPITGQTPNLDHFGPRNVDGITQRLDHGHAPLENLLQVKVADLNPATNPPGTRWFAAANLWVVGDQDVTNNGRWVEVIPSFSGTTFSFTYPGGTAGQWNIRSIPGLPDYMRIIDERAIGPGQTSAAFAGPNWTPFVGGVPGVVRAGYGADSTANPAGADGVGSDGDIMYAAAGTGSNTATWTFANLQAGQYRVSVTYPEHANRATNAPFTVYNGTTGGPSLGTFTINQQIAANDLSSAGVNWEDVGLGYFTITGSTLTVRLTDNANGIVIADAVRIELVSPEIEVIQDTLNVADNVGIVNYGSTLVGTPVDRTFTVRNTGNGMLTLGALTVPVTGYTVVTPPSVNVLPGQQTTFVVRFTAPSLGTFTGQVSFPTNDSDENPFNFSVTAVAGPAPFTQIIDDGEPGFSTTGPAWVSFAGQGFNNDVTFALGAGGTEAAIWTFSSLTSGLYRVSATWTEHPNRATNAIYQVFTGSTLLGTETVNQELAPNHYSVNGAAWRILGSTYNITSGSLAVVLPNIGDEYVIADAVRIELLSPDPVALIDDGDTGYTQTGGFTSFPGQGFNGDVSYAPAGTGSESATFTFAGLATGIYRVSATWTPDPNRATNAPFSVLDGPTLLATVAVNQEAQPSTFSTVSGVTETRWQDLGNGFYYITSGTLVVRLTDAANEYVIADAIRIERIV